MRQEAQGLTAYDTALAFSHASEILYKRFDQSLRRLNYKDASLVIPFMVNCSFACELFLKALINQPKRGHKLSELYKYLLESDAVVANSIKQDVLETLRNSNKTLEYSFEEGLTRVENVFERFRYIHEPSAVEEPSYNYFFLIALMISLEAHAESKFGRRPRQKQNNPYSWRA